MKTQLSILFSLLSTLCVYGQSYTYYDFNEYGDSIVRQFPPHDSTYVHNQLVIKFKEGTLNKNLLCFDCNVTYNSKAKHSPQEVDYDCLQDRLEETFAVDSGIIMDPALVSALMSKGGVRIRRLTYTSPCKDTLSLTRLGDTIVVDDYNWMYVEFNNDTSLVSCLATLSIFFRHRVHLADFNYYVELARHPSDPYYIDPPNLQRGFKMMGMPTVWDDEVGHPDIKIGVVDNGLDYRRCEFGAIEVSPGPGPGLKVGEGGITQKQMLPAGPLLFLQALRMVPK